MSETKSNFFRENAETIIFLSLTILVLAIYAQTVGFAFINLDDNQYVFDNLVVGSGLSWNTVQWAFTVFHSANWHPLTWLSHALDVELFGMNAGGHHATNIVFHLINSILAFVVFRKMTGSTWRSALLAALFAVHPTHAESVAWVSERKDVLSTMFWLLTMWAYLRYARERKGEEEKGRKGDEETGDSDDFNDPGKTKKLNNKETSDSRENKISASPSLPVSASPRLPFSLSYLAVIALFALGLMSKPMLVTLPFVLLLIDFWSLERLKTLRDLPALIVEKIPLFVLTAASSYVTVLAQKAGGAVETLEFLPLGTRVLNAALSYAKYIGMLFYPANLGVWYPYDRNFPAWQLAAAAILLLAITALCLWQMRARKYLLMGWLWFLGTLVPVIGIVQVGSQPLADRYTYIPYFGLLIMLVWGLGDVFRYLNVSRKAFYAVFAAAILIFTILSFKQVSLWRSDEILYKHTLSVTKNNYLIAHNLCNSLTLKERMDEAEPFCRAAIEAKPDYAEVYNTLGILQTKRGEYAAAEANFRETLRRLPNYATAYSNLAVAQILQGKPEEAEANLQKAAEIDRGSIAPAVFVNALNDLAIAFSKQGKFEKAAESLQRLLYLAPENTDARVKFALTLFLLKRYDEAQTQAEELLRQNPNLAEAYNLYGLILLEKNQKPQAAAQFEKALQIKPGLAEAKANLEKARK